MPLKITMPLSRLTPNTNRNLAYSLIAIISAINTVISFDFQVLSYLPADNFFSFQHTNRTFLSDWSLYIQAALWENQGLQVYSLEFTKAHGGVMPFLYSPLVLHAIAKITGLLGVDTTFQFGLFLFVVAYPLIIALLFTELARKISGEARDRYLITLILGMSSSLFWLNSIAAGNVSGFFLLLIIYFLLVSKIKLRFALADILIVCLSIIKPHFLVLVAYRPLFLRKSNQFFIALLLLFFILSPQLYHAFYNVDQYIAWVDIIRSATIGGHDDGLLFMRYLNNKLAHRQLIGTIIYLLIYAYAIKTWIQLNNQIQNKASALTATQSLRALALLGLLIVIPRYNDYDVFAVFIVATMLIAINKSCLHATISIIGIFSLLRLANYLAGGNYFYASVSSYLFIFLIYLAIRSPKETFRDQQIHHDKT